MARPRLRPARSLLAACAALGLAGALALPATASATERGGATLVPVGLDRPFAVTTDRGDVFVVNQGADDIVELAPQATTPPTATVVRTVQGASYRFRHPVAIAADGPDVFVVNRGSSVTELAAATGALVRVVRGGAYDFSGPSAIAIHRGDVYVTDAVGDAVTEFSASTGDLVKVVSAASAPADHLDDPVALAFAGAELWVVSEAGGQASDAGLGAVTELSAATLARKRVVDATADGLVQPDGVSFDGTHLWVTDGGGYQVTELDADGDLDQVVTDSSLDQNYGFNHPSATVASGGEVYTVSPPGSSPMVTQITASTAEGNWFECDTNSPDPDFVYPTGIAVAAGSIWVTSPRANLLTQLSVALSGTAVAWYS